jgi:hypothetical protein
MKDDRPSPYSTPPTIPTTYSADCLIPNLQAFQNFHGSLKVVMTASAIYKIFEQKSLSDFHNGHKICKIFE